MDVLIAGGGVAGVEAMLALHDLAGDRVDVTLLTPEHDFVHRPMAVAEPFGRGAALRRPLAVIAHDGGAMLRPGLLQEVDDDARVAWTAEGEELRFDALLVAVGAGSEPAFPKATTWTPESDREVFSGLLRDLEGGYAKRVAFVVPPGAAWPLPAYELALMTAHQAWSMGHDDVRISVVTHESAPLGLFGRAASDALRADLEEARVDVVTGVEVKAGENGRPDVDADRVVALPKAVPRTVRGVPVDAAGFVPVDLNGAVQGAAALWAAGDATAFPIKQGGIAAQQADAAAESIAALAGAPVEPSPFRPVLRGMVLTGRGRQWLRRDLVAGGEAETADSGDDVRHALWWPPTKVAGRYLAPYLTELQDADAMHRPEGHPVELDVEREVPAAADALRQARERTE
jgi:sulfide:quinone oxidoreductase